MASVALIKFLDKIFGNIACLLLSLFSRKKEIDTKNPRKILFIQLWGVGETILTLPAVESVRKKFKRSDIYILATERNKEVYSSSGIKLKVLLLGVRRFDILIFIARNIRKFDIVLDLEEYLNISSIISFFIGKQRVGFSSGIRGALYNQSIKYDGSKHTVQVFLDIVRQIGADSKSRIPKLRYLDKDLKKIKSILNHAPKKAKIIGIVPGAAESAKSRMWPHQRFARLANSLIKKGYFLVFIGTKGEKNLIDDIVDVIDDKSKVFDSAGLISLDELFCLVDNIDLLITNDTGPLHIASAQNTNVIGLFGPNLPERFGPYMTKGVSLYDKESCDRSPCINVHKGQVPDCLYKKDSKDYQKCMKAISVDYVLDAVEKLI